jgi:hypothetical protein
VSTHRVDNARRRTIAVGGLGIGAVALVVAVAVDRQSVRDIAVVTAAVLLTAGVRALFLALRGGPAERFEVTQEGLSYTNRSGTRRWRWADLAYIRVHRPRFPGPGAEFFGAQVRGAIQPRAGRAVRFTGHTHDLDTLITAVRAHCDPVPPATVRDRARWLGLTAAALGAIGLLVLYARANRRVTDFSGPEVTVVQPGLGATGIILVLTGFLLCLIAAVVGAVKAVRRS